MTKRNFYNTWSEPGNLYSMSLHITHSLAGPDIRCAYEDACFFGQLCFFGCALNRNNSGRFLSVDKLVPTDLHAAHLLQFSAGTPCDLTASTLCPSSAGCPCNPVLQNLMFEGGGVAVALTDHEKLDPVLDAWPSGRLENMRLVARTKPSPER